MTMQVLEEESENFSSQMFSSGFFVVHNPAGSGHHNVSKLSGWKQVVGPLFNVWDANVEPGTTKSRIVREG